MSPQNVGLLQQTLSMASQFSPSTGQVPRLPSFPLIPHSSTSHSDSHSAMTHTAHKWPGSIHEAQSRGRISHQHPYSPVETITPQVGPEDPTVPKAAIKSMGSFIFLWQFQYKYLV